MALTNADLINVADIRAAIAAFLTTDLTGVGNPVETVYAYEPKDFQKDPVIAIVSEGDEYGRRTYTERIKATISLNVLSFVLFSDPDSGWTPENCEDKLNEVKRAFWVSFFNNQQITVDSKAVTIQVEGKSSIVPANVGGADYRLEIIPITAEVFNG